MTYVYDHFNATENPQHGHNTQDIHMRSKNHEENCDGHDLESANNRACSATYETRA